MIARLWQGWAATSEAADLYQDFLRSAFLPSIHSIGGYCGARILRRCVGNEVEFTTITYFASLDAIGRFEGEDCEAAHDAPRGRELLVRFDSRCAHYEVVVDDKLGF